MDKSARENRSRLYLRLLFRAVFFVVCVFALYYVIPPLLSLFAPFLFALFTALLLNPLINKINKKFRIPRQIITVFLLAFLFFGFMTLLVWIVHTVVGEAVSLAKNFQSTWDHMVSVVNLMNQKLKWISDFFPSHIEVTLIGIMDSIYLWFRAASSDFLNMVFQKTSIITTRIGSGIVSCVVFLLASYFICVEYDTFETFVEKSNDNRLFYHFRIVADAVKAALGGYLKAQVMLALLAFIVMFPALLIYGQAYSFLIALFLAFIDFLPIVGTAIILVPWGLFELIGGDAAKGMFLLILAGAFFVLRKIMEPKIVGSQTGLHPLIALVSIYVGMKISGIWGAILGPIAVMVAVSILKAGVFHDTVEDIKELFNIVCTDSAG